MYLNRKVILMNVKDFSIKNGVLEFCANDGSSIHFG